MPEGYNPAAAEAAKQFDENMKARNRQIEVPSADEEQVFEFSGIALDLINAEIVGANSPDDLADKLAGCLDKPEIREGIGRISAAAERVRALDGKTDPIGELHKIADTLPGVNLFEAGVIVARKIVNSRKAGVIEQGVSQAA